MSDGEPDDNDETHRAVTDLIVEVANVSDAPSAYAFISAELKRLTNADFAGLLIYEAGRSDVRFVGATGLGLSNLSDFPKVGVDPEVRARLVQGRRSLSLTMSRLEEVPEVGRALYDAMDLGPVILASIVFRDTLVGYLVVARKKDGQEFNDREQRITRLIADCIASVLDHVRTSFRLARTEAETDKILSLAPIGLMTVDAKGMITSMNNLMMKMLDVSDAAELVGTNLLEMEPMAKSGLDDLVLQALEGTPSEKDNVHFVPNPDKAFYMHVKVAPLPSETGDVETALMVAMDITSNVRLQSQLERSYEKLIQTYQELERVTKMKSQFIDVVSHELRTPLTVLRGYLDLVESESPMMAEPKLAQKMRTIRANADKLYTLVESMLDVSRLEKGTLQINPEPTRVDSVLEEVVEARMHDASGKKQTISLQVEGELPLIMADRRRLRDVFNNVIDNAVKYTQEEGKVQVGARDEGKIVHIWVRDNGVGIPLENLGRIFDRFYIVASDDLSHQVNRIGLSLPISKGIVEAHGGRIWVESQVGKGSVFHIDLPKESKK
ncbi:MAG: ATP-binding protein [Thermoplasmata archaeon]|nr:ATP-binding protein [Thermoplasmata archaeon]